ncbi:peroxiredoxin [Chitinimonas sp. BJB300]|uniref:peroxiredoxin n=1 Tax=Chitinimonas sp. BJB300 TaxID=1559339 RepID=UPI000C1112AD|nr:peroxiredoxin [Chitinimonas sp. BJB300]PHV12140.1 peroxiredoxin [Chitinimonas sp. BJB300]TSJ90127.1 peroxiredoxin [Chitinimonas sp. BJB300]
MKSLIVSLLFICNLFAQAAATPGQAAPAFNLTDQTGQKRTNEQFIGKWLVLYFYPKADTPGCTEEACSFRDDIILLRALGAEIVGISTDSLTSIQAFGQKHQLPFTLLSDPDGSTAARYGALLDLGIMKFAKRHTFLIDPQGRIVKRYTDVDTKTYAKTIITDLRAMTGKQ